MFIVSEYYRGAMNVGKLRAFRSKAKAKKYWDKLLAPFAKWGRSTSHARAYELFEDKEPKLLRTDKDWA